MSDGTRWCAARRGRRVLARATTALLVAALGAPAGARAAVLAATPTNLGGVFAAAQPGDTILLAAGDYGRFAGGQKAGTVTIRPAPGAAATMEVAFDAARNVRLEGLTVRGATIGGRSADVAIAGSTFTAQAVVQASAMVDANIVFDGDTFADIDACADCYEGRLHVAGRGPGPSGVVIRNSRFGPGGDADGIQSGADGVQILHNEFTGIKQVGEVHTDAVQLYGQAHTTIAGNFFHDNDVAIMAPDGGDHEVIADNVIVGGAYRPAVQLGSHAATSFVHNTVRDVDVHMDHKAGSPPSSDGIVRDNVFVNGGVNALDPGNCSACAVDHNLFSRAGAAAGTDVVVGSPAFVGGAQPAGYGGFLLAAGSPGKGSASDGLDRGARISVPPAAPPAGAPAGPAIRRLRVARSVSFPQLRRGLRVQIAAAERVRLSLRLTRRHGRRALARRSRSQPAGTRAYVLRPRRSRLGRRRAMTLTLHVTATTRARTTTTLRARIRVRR